MIPSLSLVTASMMRRACCGIIALASTALIFAQTTPLTQKSDSDAGFLEPQTPFLRTALVFKEGEHQQVIRRGVIVPLGDDDRWACFDPDQLRWVVVWKAPPGQPPLTYDSMAAVSFPDKKAKAKRAPRLRGEILLTNVDDQSPLKPRSIGSFPVEHGRWDGIILSGDTVVLNYQREGRSYSESVSADEKCHFIRSVEIQGEGDLEAIEMRYVNSGEVTKKPILRRQVRMATARFPEKFQVENAKLEMRGVFRIRNLSFPDSPRPVRATDLAFLSNGTGLVSTLDGDIWRVEALNQPRSVWRRVATGLFEPMAIEVNEDDQVYVLGRDQITELVDLNSDGVIDEFRNVSDQVIQSIHTRDYSTSLAIGPDGDFYVAKGGILSPKAKGLERENSLHRGSIVRVSSDGVGARVIGDGLRMPYVGVRQDGVVFASDQQGHHVPSTPIYTIPAADEVPYFGHEPSNHRKQTAVAEPLLYYPYQHNRSGAAFVELPQNEAFPDFSSSFLQMSWDGRIFSLSTPEEGLSFSYRWPLQLDFPSLNAAVHPHTGQLYAVGLGISGYLPTTEKEIGLASVEQGVSLPIPRQISTFENTIKVSFHRPFLAEESILAQNAELRLFNLRRTKKYGSGHYRADLKPGEDRQMPLSFSLAEDRQSLEIRYPALFRADVFDLKLILVSGSVETPLHLYCSLKHLPAATEEQMVSLRAGEVKKDLEPGNVERGEALFTEFSCVGCHSLSEQKLTGPPLLGIGARATVEDLRESILKPNAKITKGYQAGMPSFEGVLDEQSLADLITYLKSL